MDPTVAAGVTDFVNVGDVGAAVTAGKYALAAVVVLAGLVRFLRGPVLRAMPTEWGFVKWSKSMVGGWVFNFVSAELMSLSGYFMAVPASGITVLGIVGALVGGVALTFTGAGAHEFAKDTGLGPTKPAEPAPAPVLNATQAANVLDLPSKKES